MIADTFNRRPKLAADEAAPPPVAAPVGDAALGHPIDGTDYAAGPASPGRRRT